MRARLGGESGVKLARALLIIAVSQAFPAPLYDT